MKPKTRRVLILATVALLVLLIFGAVVNIFSGPTQRAMSYRTKIVMFGLSSAIEMYLKEIGPLDSLDNHQILVRLTETDSPRHRAYFSYDSNDGRIPKTTVDAWGHDFRFIPRADGKIIIWSAGPNGIFEDSPGSDDIRSE